jgi:hypothetical protein
VKNSPEAGSEMKVDELVKLNMLECNRQEIPEIAFSFLCRDVEYSYKDQNAKYYIHRIHNIKLQWC